MGLDRITGITETINHLLNCDCRHLATSILRSIPLIPYLQHMDSEDDAYAAVKGLDGAYFAGAPVKVEVGLCTTEIKGHEQKLCYIQQQQACCECSIIYEF